MLGQHSQVIQENISLSECNIWELQRKFFAEQGIEAWVNQVPYYVTCNPYIANV